MINATYIIFFPKNNGRSAEYPWYIVDPLLSKRTWRYMQQIAHSTPSSVLLFCSIRIRNHQLIYHFTSYFQVGHSIARNLVQQQRLGSLGCEMQCRLKHRNGWYVKFSRPRRMTSWGGLTHSRLLAHSRDRSFIRFFLHQIVSEWKQSRGKKTLTQ